MLLVVASVFISQKPASDTSPMSSTNAMAVEEDTHGSERLSGGGANDSGDVARAASGPTGGGSGTTGRVSLADSQAVVQAPRGSSRPDPSAGGSGAGGAVGGQAESATASSASSARTGASTSVGVIPGGFGGSAPSVANPNQSLSEPPPLAETRSREDIEIEVPFGAKVPIVFLDDTPRPAPQERVLEQIMEEFTQAVEANPANWNVARERADYRYKILYGDAAFNQLTMGAALQALEERNEAVQ